MNAGPGAARPKGAVPIHHGGYEVFKDPIESFRRKAAGTASLATDIHYLERGEAYRVPFPTGEQPAR